MTNGNLSRAVVGLVMLLSPSAAVPAPRSAPPASPVLIEYHLPKTRLEFSGALMVRSCADNRTATLEATFEARSVPVRGPGPIRFSGAALSHGLQDTSLSITTDPNGVLSSVNAASANRGPEVLGNIVKLALKAATMSMPRLVPPRAVMCTDAAIALTKEVTEKECRIRALRSEQDRNPSEARAAHIAALTLEVASTRATRLRLQWKIHADLDPSTMRASPGTAGIAATSQALAIDRSAFREDPATLLTGFEPAEQMALTVALPKGLPPGAQEHAAAYEAAAQPADPKAAALVLPSPALVDVAALLVLRGTEPNSEIAASQVLADVPMPQWGPLRRLPLRTSFGRKRTFQARFNAFGQQSEASVSTTSRAAAITGGLAGIATDAEAFATAHGPAAREKAERDRLTVQQELNRLRACREAAGNSDLWWDCDTLLAPSGTTQTPTP